MTAAVKSETKAKTKVVVEAHEHADDHHGVVDAITTGEVLVFSPQTQERIANILKRYPPERSRSALIPVLKLAQDEFGGWLSLEALNLVAETLNLAPIRVYEVATFYTMFNLRPVGKFHVQVCTNCACMIRGSHLIAAAAKKEAGVKNYGDISKDGNFSITEVECLGACVEAPMMQINNHYYTRLTAEKVKEILKAFKEGKTPENATPTPPLKDGY